jgi:hypothetical protein
VATERTGWLADADAAATYGWVGWAAGAIGCGCVALDGTVLGAAVVWAVVDAAAGTAGADDATGAEGVDGATTGAGATGTEAEVCVLALLAAGTGPSARPSGRIAVMAGGRLVVGRAAVRPAEAGSKAPVGEAPAAWSRRPRGPNSAPANGASPVRWPPCATVPSLGASPCTDWLALARLAAKLGPLVVSATVLMPRVIARPSSARRGMLGLAATWASPSLIGFLPLVMLAQAREYQFSVARACHPSRCS